MHTFYKHLLPTFLFTIICAIFATLQSCHPEDRSGEEPFAPTVQTLSATQVGDSFLLRGVVVRSPNSHVLERGFIYGNDTLKLTKTSEETTDTFSAYTKTLEQGKYYIVAYARNGVGTGTGDTLRIEKP